MPGKELPPLKGMALKQVEKPLFQTCTVGFLLQVPCRVISNHSPKELSLGVQRVSQQGGGKQPARAKPLPLTGTALPSSFNNSFAIVGRSCFPKEKCQGWAVCGQTPRKENWGAFTGDTWLQGPRRGVREHNEMGNWS